MAAEKRMLALLVSAWDSRRGGAQNTHEDPEWHRSFYSALLHPVQGYL